MACDFMHIYMRINNMIIFLKRPGFIEIFQKIVPYCVRVVLRKSQLVISKVQKELTRSLKNERIGQDFGKDDVLFENCDIIPVENGSFENLRGEPFQKLWSY